MGRTPYLGMDIRLKAFRLILFEPALTLFYENPCLGLTRFQGKISNTVSTAVLKRGTPG